MKTPHKQKTLKGAEIPIPKKRDFLRNLKSVSKVRKSSPNRPTKKR